jgi:hypothetical protein
MKKIKNLTDYIIEQQELEFVDQMINEGFWQKLGSILGKGAKTIKNAMSNFSKGFNNALTTANVVAAKSDDKESKKIANELNDEINKSKSEKDALKALKEKTEKIIYGLGPKGDISKPDFAVSLKYALKEYPDDSECKELLDKLEKALEEKFGSKAKTAEKNVEAISNKLENSDVVPDGNSEDNKEEVERVEDKSSLGTGDDENKAVTQKQETNAVTAEIKDNTDFFKQVVSITNGKVDGETLRDSLVNMINKSLKNESKDKEGKTVYTWKKDTKGFQTKNEENLIKGMGAILCGLVAINHSGMNEELLKVLQKYGFSAKNFLNNLQK